MLIPAILLASLFCGGAVAFFFSHWGVRWGFADVPNVRSSHHRVTPRGGGAGIPLAACLSLLVFSRDSLAIIIPCGLLAVFSLFDDRFSLPVVWRLFVQILSSLALVVWIQSPWLINLYTGVDVLLLIGMVMSLVLVLAGGANFFNFMDGINGIAAFEAIISFGFLGLYTRFFLEQEAAFWIALAIVAASMGFLLFNFPKARVFMGDVGSVTLGFLFASMAILLARDAREFIVILSFQSVFYVDCIATLLIRLKSGENLFQAHLMHFYQRLVHDRRWSHIQVTLVYAFLQIFVGLSALLLRKESLCWIIGFWVLQFVFYFGIRISARLAE